MSGASEGRSVSELFCSYSHKDARLSQLLETHLKALQRSGLIRSWYDRKIDPGADWNEEIQSAMERAGIILLLISPDFLASDYCYEIELPFAMRCHESGKAIVIPILLRPGLYQDAPFAKLQMLPRDARPIIEWGRRDEAFNDVASAIRSVIIEKRLHPDAVVSHASESPERVLDAAVPAEVRVNEPADVVALIRAPDSNGLRAVLQFDDSYSVLAADVRTSEAFEIHFPRGQSGKLLPASVQFELQAAGFDPPKQTQRVRIMPKTDSPVCVFMLTPQREGRLALMLNVLVDGELIATLRLVTTAVSESVLAAPESLTPYNITEIPLRGKAGLQGPRKRTHVSQVGSETGADFRFSDVKARLDAQAPSLADVFESATPEPPSSPQDAVGGYDMTGLSNLRRSGPKRPLPPTRNKRKLPWIGVCTAAAGAALLVLLPRLPTGVPTQAPTGVHPHVATESPDDEQPRALNPAPLYQTIAACTFEIKRNPANPELYVRRAAAYKRSNNLEAASKDVNRALELKPNYASALTLRAEIIKEQKRQATSGVAH